jgi:hypothetical protein
MKKLLLVLALLFPFTSFAAVATPWNATSTDAGYISPNRVNGNDPWVQAVFFKATSSTATSTFPLAQITNALKLGSDYITDLTGQGLTVSSNALAVDSSFIKGLFSGTYPIVDTNGVFSLAFGTTTSNTWAGTQTFNNVTVNGTCTGCSSGAGITAIGPTGQTQSGSTITLASSTTGTDFSITGSSNTLTFNLPTASASARGLLSSSDFSTFNGKLSSLVGAAGGTSGNVLITNGLSASAWGTVALGSSNAVSGTLGVANGGTGSTTLTGILKGNGTSGVATAVSNTDYQAPISLTTTGSSGAATFDGTTLNIPQYSTGNAFSYPFPSAATSTTLTFSGGIVSNASTTIGTLHLPLSDGGLAVFGNTVSSGATTTAGTGLTYTGNAFNVNTSQNIATLSNLTSNGFVKTSGGTGALSIDTSTYLTSAGAVTSIKQNSGSAQVGAITLATSSAVTSNGVTIGQTITNSSGTFTFTPTVSVSAIPNAALANSTISGIALGSNLNSLTHDSTLTGTSYNGSAAVSDWGLDLTHANTWTGKQTFTYASTTGISNSYASSTNAFFGSLNLPNITGTQCLHEISGVVSGTGSDCGSGSGITGSTGQVAYFSGSNTAVGTSTIFLTTAGNFGVGTTAPSKLFTVEGNQSGGVARIQRDFPSTPSTSIIGTYDILLNETGAGSLADLTGPGQTFGVSLAGGAENIQADISSFRDGADTNGGFFVRTYNAGTPAVALAIDSSQRVGVGSTTPGTLLSVGDTAGINFSTATSTFNSTGGINLKSGCFALNGTCLSTGAVSSVANSDSTLTISPTTGSVVASLNLAHANTWSALQQFGNASSTQLSAASNTFYIDSTGHVQAKDTVNAWSGVVSPTRSFVLQTGTTTTMTGTTTGAYIPYIIAPFAGTLRQTRCKTDAGTLGTEIQINGSDVSPGYFNASTTVGKESFSSSNTFSAGDKIAMINGTPASSPTTVSCTFDATETP